MLTIWLAIALLGAAIGFIYSIRNCDTIFSAVLYTFLGFLIPIFIGYITNSLYL